MYIEETGISLHFDPDLIFLQYHYHVDIIIIREAMGVVM